MPWSLLLTALVLVLASGLIVVVERKRSRYEHVRTAIVETTLVSAARMVQKQHQKKFGRASTDLAQLESSLDSSLPSMANGVRNRS